MDKPLRVLLIEDVGSDAKLILTALEKAGFQVTHARVEDADGLKSALENETWDVVIADYQLPGFNAFAALSVLNQSGQDIPFIVVSGFVGEETAVDLMKAGAHDYLMKENLARLAPAVEREFRDAEARRESLRMERALRESEIQYRTSMDSMNDFIHVVDSDLKVVLMNRAFLAWNRQLGLPTKVIGRNLFEVYPFLSDMVRDEYRRVFKTGEIVNSEESTRLAGVEFFTDTRKIPIYEAGQVVRVLTVIRDVTENKRAADELQNSHSLLAAALESTADGILVVNRAGKVTLMNRKFLELWRIPESIAATRDDEQLLGFVLDQLQDPVKFLAKVREYYQSAKSSSMDMLAFKDGRVFERYSQPQRIGDTVVGRVWSFRDVTGRMKAEEALRTSENRTRSIVESIPIGLHMYRLESDGRLIFEGANPAADRILGMDHGIFPGQTIEEAFPTLTETEAPRHYRETAASGKTWDAEQFDIHDGAVRGVFAVHAFQTGPNAMVAAFEDITERKRTVDALRESEERFRKIFEDSPIGMALSDERHGFLKVNDAFCRMLGYTEEDLTTLSFRDITHPDHLEHDIKMVKKLSEGVIPFYQTEKRYIKKDGDFIWGSVNVSTIRKSGGRPPYFLAMIEDVTAKRETEKALAESEKKYRTIFENAIEGIFQSTPQGSYISVNPALARMCGYDSPGQMIDSITDISKQIYRHEKDRVRYTETLLREGIVNDFVTEFIKKDGTHFWISTNARAVRDERGECRYFEGMSLDITNRKILEDQVREDIREKNVLLKEVHHRVKNNLQIIVSLLNLQSGKIRDRKVLTAFDEVRHRVYSMALLHEKLYKSENFAEVPFKDYLSTLCRDLVSAFGATGRLQLDFDLEEIDLGIDTAVPCGLIVNELITNAIKHAFPKGRKGHIAVRFRRTDAKNAELTVEDDGTGLPSGLDAAKAESLGLKIIQILTDQINGKMHVRARRGAAFRIVFPVRERTVRNQRHGDTVIGQI
jgi:PAS domain S-box-containing protein